MPESTAFNDPTNPNKNFFANSLLFCLTRKILTPSRIGAGDNWISWKKEVWRRQAIPESIVKFACTSIGAADFRDRLWSRKFIAKKAVVAKPADRQTHY